MIDYSELKRLAEAALNDNGDYVALNDYGMAVPPAVVLDLIAEVEHLSIREDVLENLCDTRFRINLDLETERDRLKAEVGRLKAGVNSDMEEIERIQSEYDKQFRKARDLRAERDNLKTEVEGLRAQHGRDSAELRSLSQARDDARKERDQLKSEVEQLRGTLCGVMDQVDGNIRATVRDCVNGMDDVQDIYEYCDNIEAIVDLALSLVDQS